MKKTKTNLLATALLVSSMVLTPVSARGPVPIVPEPTEPEECEHYYMQTYEWQGWVPDDYYMHHYRFYVTYECVKCEETYSDINETDAGWHTPNYDVIGSITEGDRVLPVAYCTTCGGVAVK